jgi:hypothetical protein
VPLLPVAALVDNEPATITLPINRNCGPVVNPSRFVQIQFPDQTGSRPKPNAFNETGSQSLH